MAEWRLGSVNSWNVKTQATVLYPWPDVDVHPVDGARGPSASGPDADQEVSEDEEGGCPTALSDSLISALLKMWYFF